MYQAFFLTLESPKTVVHFGRYPLKVHLFRFLACGVFVSVGSSALAATPDKVLFVNLGGYNSCHSSSRSDTPPAGTGVAVNASHVATRMTTHYRSIQVLTLSACLGASTPPDG